MHDDWLDLLPITSLDSLLERVAVRWRETLGDELILASCLSVEGTRLVVGWSRSGESGAHSIDLPTVEPWWGNDTPRHISLRDASFPHPPDTWMVPLPNGNHPRGGVQGIGPEPAADVVTRLAESTSPLLAQGALVDRLVHDALAEKLEAMAEFAAGAGHEINNPIATINGRVQLLLKGETDPERRRSLAVIGGQAYRVRDMIGDAMLFARPSAPRPAAVDAAAVVRRVCDSLREDLEDGPRFVVDANERVPVWADETQFEIVASELVRNAMHAAGGDGTIEIAVAPGRIGNPPHEGLAHGVLTVTDDGPGLTDVDRVHLFDPFYSGRQAGRGLGFGLSKAWRIVRAHRGRIDVESVAGRTTFRVTWPARPPVSSETPGV